MTTKYQLIILGAINPLLEKILESFFGHLKELGVSNNSVILINKDKFYQEYKANAPVFCLYFGDSRDILSDLELLKILIKDASLILPIVNDFNHFSENIPEILRNINGFELSTENEIESLVSCILEGLGLLRLSRRLFISYKRSESSRIAIQLFEQFEKKGFDVFLDTHSIRPGEPFQEELWHRMADTDIVVLLNTPGFLSSHWTKEELAQASTMSIGILQLIWPNNNLTNGSELTIPLYLNEKSFGNSIYSESQSYLTNDSIEQIVSAAESLRARSLASRQDNIVTEFITSAHKVGTTVDLQPEKFITLNSAKQKELIIIPTVGVPQAFTYNQSQELVARIRSHNVQGIFLLYDHRNIREKWLNHITWLDNYLPIKTIKIVDAEKWLIRN